MSADSCVIAIDMSVTASPVALKFFFMVSDMCFVICSDVSPICAIPDDLSIAPIVDVYCFAASSDKPNDVTAFDANSSIAPDIFRNVTSTTFWTSSRSEPTSIQAFDNSTSAFTAKAEAITPPSFFTAPRMFFILPSMTPAPFSTPLVSTIVPIRMVPSYWFAMTLTSFRRYRPNSASTAAFSSRSFCFSVSLIVFFREISLRFSFSKSFSHLSSFLPCARL